MKKYFEMLKYCHLAACKRIGPVYIKDNNNLIEFCQIQFIVSMVTLEHLLSIDYWGLLTIDQLKIWFNT